MRSYLVGIKGTGMANLAVLLKAMGHEVGGCDSGERFATDSVLEAHGLLADHGFCESLLPPAIDLLIHSSAYSPSLPIIALAAQRGVPIFDYPAFIAHLTRQQESWAVVGTHGKTTTVSVATHLLSEATGFRFPFYALYGSQHTERMAAPYWGSQVALFEGCEYQDHFLSYRLRGLLLTTIDWDHPDYFGDLDAVYRSFEAVVRSLCPGGIFIYNSDDPLVLRLARQMAGERSDLTAIPYGFGAEGLFRIRKRGRHCYTFDGFKELCFTLVVDEPALVADHLGALALSVAMLLDQDPPRLYLDESALVTDEVLPTAVAHLGRCLATFGGVVGRLEVMGEEGGVLYLDDYAHHPREIEVLLGEVKSRYPTRRVVALFSPHTASRTRALLKEFVSALKVVDHLVIQPTYASARRDGGGGDDPASALYEHLSAEMGERVILARTDAEAIEGACTWLQEGTVCITMGAGNNRNLGERIAERRRSMR